ncbi:MAG: Uma2 family endonuclease [Microcystaceae cyanobacterium]
MLITINPHTLQLESGSEVILRGQTWEDYETLLKIRQDRSLPKLCFNAKTQEIQLMSPLASHGKRIDIMRDLVKILLRKENRDWDCFDPITIKKFKQAGVEPDTCFYEKNRQAILGKDRIDLSIDPPPDLAIEVDLTSITRLSSYEPLAIPELWIYRPGELKIYLWQNTTYQDRDRSIFLKNWDVKSLFPQYIELGWVKGSSLALRQFEEEVING